MTTLGTHDRGIGLVGVIALILVIGFAVVMTIRLVPVMVESMKVSTVLDGVAKDPAVRGKPAMEVMNIVNSQMHTHEVTRVRREDIEVVRHSSGELNIYVDYEARLPLVANVDLVIKFGKQAEVTP